MENRKWFKLLKEYDILDEILESEIYKDNEFREKYTKNERGFVSIRHSYNKKHSIYSLFKLLEYDKNVFILKNKDLIKIHKTLFAIRSFDDLCIKIDYNEKFLYIKQLVEELIEPFNSKSLNFNYNICNINGETDSSFYIFGENLISSSNILDAITDINSGLYSKNSYALPFTYLHDIDCFIFFKNFAWIVDRGEFTESLTFNEFIKKEQ